MKRIAFYGGSFNPVHCGHQTTVLNVLATADVEWVYVAPVYAHPDGKKLVHIDQRMIMCDKMLDVFRGSHCGIGVNVSRIEQRAWEKYHTGLTCDTLELFYEENPDTHCVLVLGSDVKEALPNWTGLDKLKKMEDDGKLSFFFVERHPAISSTAVREKLARGEMKDVWRWVPATVLEYITEHGLYL